MFVVYEKTKNLKGKDGLVLEAEMFNLTPFLSQAK